jgi:hypothetical protein
MEWFSPFLSGLPQILFQPGRRSGNHYFELTETCRTAFVIRLGQWFRQLRQKVPNLLPPDCTIAKRD